MSISNIWYTKQNTNNFMSRLDNKSEKYNTDILNYPLTLGMKLKAKLFN